MKKLLASLFFGAVMSQSILLANAIAEQKKTLEQSLTVLFKYKNAKQIKEMYASELRVLEAQYARNKQVEDFQKRQQPDIIRTPVFTSPFKLTSSQEWEERMLEYSNKISVTKIPRRTNTELVFHFPQLDAKIINIADRYKIEIPSVKVTSILLSSGKLLPIDQAISPKSRELSITADTNGEAILKINLTMDYQTPNESNTRTVLSSISPSLNGMALLPSFSNIVLLKLTEDKANTIIHIDAEDQNGNTLAAKTEERIVNINELSIQASRIDLLKGLIKSIEDGKIRFPKDAIEYMNNNSDKYLEFLSNSTRELSKVFSGEIDRIIIYTTEKPINKHLEFSLY